MPNVLDPELIVTRDPRGEVTRLEGAGEVRLERIRDGTVLVRVAGERFLIESAAPIRVTQVERGRRQADNLTIRHLSN